MESNLSYAIRRLLLVLPILFFVSSFTFVLARIGPGDPIRIAAGQFRDPEAFARVRHERGLDKPLYEQYGIYMKNVLLHGDFGESYQYRGQKVTEVIFPALWHTIQYNSAALIITLGLGIPLGVFAARQQGTWSDPASIGVFLFVQAIPVLLLIPFMLFAFSLKLHLLPARGWPQAEDCRVHLNFLGDSYRCIGVFSKEAIIPVLALSIPGVASWGRYTRAFTLGVLREDYIRTARSKGISEFRVMTQHVLRNALLPLSTLIAFSLIGLLGGAFFIETLTGIPGIGRLAIGSVTSRDYDLIMAITLLGASSFVLASIAIDIGYTLIDPRIRYSARSN